MKTAEIQKLTDTDELNRIIFDCQARLEDMVEVKRQEAEEKIRAIAEKVGMSPEDILGLRAKPAGKKTAGRTSKSPAKYKDPDSDKTWSGKGRLPNWMEVHVKAGGKKEDFEIKSDDERRPPRKKGEM